MAIPTFEAVSTGNTTSSVLELIVPHTVPGSLTDSMVVVLVTSDQFAEATSCLWNASSTTAMTPIEFVTGNFWSQGFYLLNPESGTHSADVYWTTTSNDIGVTVMTFSGAKAVSGANQSGGTGTSPSVAVTTVADDSMLVSFTMSQDTDVAPAGSETERSEFGVGAYRVSSQTLGVATAGTNNMTQTLTDSKTYQINAFSIDSVDTGFLPQLIII